MISEDTKKWVRNKLWYQVPVSTCVIDKNFKIVDANPSFAEKYGDWQNRFCYSVYKGRSERCENCAASQTFSDGLVRVREEQGIVKKDEPTYYLVHMVPMIGNDGEIQLVVEMSTDITFTKQLEQQKLEAERLAAVGQTVAGLAHGVKNLLMGIEGGMYVIRSGLERVDAQRILKGWEMLEEDINRITSFVKEFLDFARGRTPQVRLIDPNRPVRNVFELFRDAAKLKGIEIKANLQEEMPYAPMDEEGIHTCMANLVSNAIDACEISDKPNRNIVITSREQDGSLFFEVADDGSGMDYEIKKKIFTGFFSTKGSGKGTGLGLLTTRKIIQEHGGKISVESSEGAGSIFRLEFPLDRLPQGTYGEHEE